MFYRCGSGSLVQRELSAKLTEGLLYRSIDILTHATEVSVDFVVGDTNDAQTIPLQKSGTVCILFNISILIVLRTIQLNDKFCFCTIKSQRYTFQVPFVWKSGQDRSAKSRTIDDVLLLSFLFAVALPTEPTVYYASTA